MKCQCLVSSLSISPLNHITYFQRTWILNSVNANISDTTTFGVNPWLAALVVCLLGRLWCVWLCVFWGRFCCLRRKWGRGGGAHEAQPNTRNQNKKKNRTKSMLLETAKKKNDKNREENGRFVMRSSSLCIRVDLAQ